jgi:hypothetical protein
LKKRTKKLLLYSGSIPTRAKTRRIPVGWAELSRSPLTAKYRELEDEPQAGPQNRWIFLCSIHSII